MMRPRIVLAAVVTLVALAAPAGAQLDAGPRFTFRIAARADAASIEVIDPAAPLVSEGQLVFASPASSQALVTTSASQAFASAPYPSDLIANLPGTVNGLASGSAPPLPNYPFYVTSDHPATARSEQVQGPYAITSSSEASRSDAEARIGAVSGDPDVLLSRSHVSSVIDPATGAGVATASSSVDVLSLGPLLSIGRIAASAEAKVEPGSPVETSSSFEVGTITVAGIVIGLTDEGFVVGDAVVDAEQVGSTTEEISREGIDLVFMPEEVTEDGINSAGLQVRYQTVVPTQGLVEVTLTLGRVSVAASSTAFEDGVPPAPVGSVPDARSRPSVPTQTSPEASPAVVGLDGEPDEIASEVVPATVSEPLLTEGTGLFAVIALAGLALVGGTLFHRVFGSRRARSATADPVLRIDQGG